MRTFLRRILGDRRATTTIEYALIVALMVIVSISSLTTVGQNVLNKLGPASNALQ
ncbi:MAG TPA: Flp family type IVb pilin [Reyranella sp.]|nr:Flp family type IVb pilin [Reyranella sp.]